MADGTKISWTDATWNIITGCSVVTPGCTNCYAMRLAGTRLRHHPSRAGLTRDTKAGPVWTGEVRFNEQWLDQPRQWRRPRNIFVAAHSDLFHKMVLDRWIANVFRVMAECPQHQFQVLTKRGDRMIDLLAGPKSHEDWHPKLWHCSVLPNVLIGVSVEDQARADERRPFLARLAARGWRTWVSYEPALGPVDWAGWEFVRWIVSGGESGAGARPSHPDWHRAVRDFCRNNGIAYHFKQWGEHVEVSAEQHHADYVAAVDRYAPGEYDVLLDGDGTTLPEGSMQIGRRIYMRRVGKRRAGRLLDDRTWDEVPNG